MGDILPRKLLAKGWESGDKRKEDPGGFRGTKEVDTLSQKLLRIWIISKVGQKPRNREVPL